MEEVKRCPCQYEEIEPCSSNCTCANPIMSGGCLRCCAYGSYEQRMNKAELLAGIIDDYDGHRTKEINKIFTKIEKEEVL